MLYMFIGMAEVLLFIALVRVMMAKAPRGQGEERGDEIALLRELNDGMHKMEERVDALETILTDRPARRAGASRGARR